MKKFLHFLKDESGATAIEYGFIVALIVIGIVSGVQAIGTQVKAPLVTVSQNLSSR